MQTVANFKRLNTSIATKKNAEVYGGRDRVRRKTISTRRTTKRRGRIPSPPSNHPTESNARSSRVDYAFRRVLVVKVKLPLFDISVHIVQPPRIRRKLRDGRSHLEICSRTFLVRAYAAAICLVAIQGASKPIRRSRARSTRVFPLSFGRKRRRNSGWQKRRQNLAKF